MSGAVWGGWQPQPWHNDIIWTPQVIQNPKSEPSCGYNCVSLLLYAYVQHVNMLKYIVYV